MGNRKTCENCEANNAEYICRDCEMLYCEECADRFSYECDCYIPQIVPLKQNKRKK